MVAAGVLLITVCVLCCCVLRMKRRVNTMRQTTQLMRTTSEPYGGAEATRGVVVAMPTASSADPMAAGYVIDGTLAKKKSVEEGLVTPAEREGNSKDAELQEV